MRYSLQALTLWPEWIPMFDLDALRALSAEPTTGLYSHTFSRSQRQAKNVENRTWEQPPYHLINRWMAWHAGVNINGGKGGKRGIQEALELVSATAEHAGWPGIVLKPEQLITGCIVALAYIDGIVINGSAYIRSPDGEYVQELERRPVNPWAFPESWQLRIHTYRKLDTPIPCKGAQKLWTVGAEQRAAIRAQAAKHPEWKW